jgi:hypothetical protein
MVVVMAMSVEVAGNVAHACLFWMLLIFPGVPGKVTFGQIVSLILNKGASRV